MGYGNNIRYLDIFLDVTFRKILCDSDGCSDLSDMLWTKTDFREWLIQFYTKF